MPAKRPVCAQALLVMSGVAATLAATPARASTLAERMRAYRVPGVSVAGMHGGNIRLSIDRAGTYRFRFRQADVSGDQLVVTSPVPR